MSETNEWNVRTIEEMESDRNRLNKVTQPEYIFYFCFLYLLELRCKMHAKNLKHALFWLSRLKFLVLAGVSYFLKGLSSFDIQFFSSIEPTWSTDQWVFYFRSTWLTAWLKKLFWLPSWLKKPAHMIEKPTPWLKSCTRMIRKLFSLPSWLKKSTRMIEKA